MTDKISTDREREIIEDFAKDIARRKEPGNSPEKTVIEFRNDRQRGKAGERDICLIPTDLLRFRKYNGRIASDISSYEKIHGVLDESLNPTQEIIKEFLLKKDTENNLKLSKSIEHSGQIEPAIITCDGFLINGNRRKMTLDELGISTMKVVILPGKLDEGGPPTNKEIEQIENRYQLQSDGKSEYTNFDRAISIQRKIQAGLSLKDQLLDDPSHSGLTDKEFSKVLKKYEDEFLGPLNCIDRYLEDLGRSEMYDNISEGKADRDGRWYSFIPYYQLYKQLRDEKSRIKLEVEEDEIGDIEDMAFKIIRKKNFPDNLKLMQVIRKIPRILKNGDAKKELMKIQAGTIELNRSELNADDGFKTIDNKWGKKNGELIIGRVKVAIQRVEHKKELETTLTLLEDALKKLNHENMDPDTLDIGKLDQAFKKSKVIQERAGELESEFWERKKKLKKLLNKK
jgi:ParB/Sulfiredoxin domain